MWQWVSLTTPNSVTHVDTPARYTITFSGDGTAAIQADCNNVAATYTAEGFNISISLGAATMAACPDSLDQEFLTSLESAELYAADQVELWLDLPGDTGTMRLLASELLELPPAEAGEATGTVTAPDGVYLRTGPGVDYFPVGTAPAGTTGTIIGRSEDGAWWVAAAPRAPDGQVWVSAAYVDVTNGENVPVIPAPALPDSLVGPAWQWEAATIPGLWTTIDDPARYTITFNTDGTAAIKADCNDVTANYTVEDDQLTIALGAATAAACPDDSLDQIFLTALEGTARFFFQGGELFLDVEGGAMRLAATPGTG
jgi:heat shock protein HslJ